MAREWILQQQETWLVVDKPAGLSVHNELGKDLISIFTQILKTPVAPVFRIDQETSGLVLLSTSSETTSRWHLALNDLKSCTKEYLCVVRGGSKAKPLPQKGTWSDALTDKAEGRQNPLGKSPNRKTCTTHYEILAQNQYFTELSCVIETGRQHQIRKHAAHHRRPLVGDSRYGDKKYNSMIFEQYQIARMCLHAYRLRCQFDGHSFDWTSPRPEEFKRLLS